MPALARPGRPFTPRFIMKRIYLGEFEELVLLIVAMYDGEAYGVSIMHEIVNHSGRAARLNQVHAALQRLEEKGMISSRMSEPTAQRGGRRKRIFTVTLYGQQTLQYIRSLRENLWGLMPSSMRPTTGS